MADKKIITDTFVKNFVQKNRVERALFELSSPKKRHRFTGKLNHNWEVVFNMKTLIKIEKEDDFKEKIQSLLNFKNDEPCYVISNYGELDDSVLPFGAAYDVVYASGLASLLVNIKADTFFFVTEQESGPALKFIGKI